MESLHIHQMESNDIKPCGVNDGSTGDFLLAENRVTEEAMPPFPRSTVKKLKNPWAAFGLSLLLTGGGQFYNGQHRKGALQLAGSAVGTGLLVSGMLATTEDILVATTELSVTGETEVKEARGKTRIVTGLALLMGLKAWSMIDAPIAANSINREARRASLQIIPFVNPGFAGARLELRF